MFWTKSTAYALMAVYEIAKRQSGQQNPPGVRAADIARKYKLPTAYAAKILGQLARAGVLRSGRGPSGGFHITRSPAKISLWDVLDGVHAFGDPEEKPFGGYAGQMQSVLNKATKEAMGSVRDSFRKFSVADLL